MFFKSKNKSNYLAFMSGKVVPLESVEDAMFSQKMLGDGYAIEPTEQEVYSPVDGEVLVAFHTGHAYGLKTKDNVEILLHLGIDTVELDGLGFTSYVSEGSKVKKGDLIAKMDLDLVKNNGKHLTSMMIFTSGEKIKILKENQDVKGKDNKIIEVL